MSLSSGESEYYALSGGVSEALALREAVEFCTKKRTVLKAYTDLVLTRRGPSPPVRPVIRGLISDVIDEMRAPPSYQDPAEVSGGVELSPLLASLPPRRQSAAPVQGLFRPSGPAPLDEDVFGRRIGQKPPPYEVAPPPPYDGVNPEGLREISQRKVELQAREKALEDSRVELRTQVAQLAEAQQQAHAQSALFAQAQAAIQSQAGGSFETQASAILQTMAKSAEDAARRSAESLEASHQVAAAAASAPLAPPPPPQAASSELTSALTSLRDRLERVEAAFAESVRAAAAQELDKPASMVKTVTGEQLFTVWPGIEDRDDGAALRATAAGATASGSTCIGGCGDSERA
eukprot:s256_g7.t1